MQTPRITRPDETGRFSRPAALTRAASRDRVVPAAAPDRRQMNVTRPSPTASQLVRAGLLLAAGLVIGAGLRGGAAGAREIEGPAFAQLVNLDQ